MPIGILGILLIAYMAARKGIDFPLVAVALVVGDKSDGSIIEGLVDGIGNFLGVIWDIVMKAWPAGPPPVPAAMMHAAHLAQATGVIG